MGMRFTEQENQERFATVVGGRPGKRGARPVEVSPELRAFLERLFGDAAARRAFLERRAEAVASDPALSEADRALLRAIPEEKVRAIEIMIPPPSVARRATVLAAGVTALGIFLGLALPILAQDIPPCMPPGGCRPDVENGPETPPLPDGGGRLEITKGIRPGLEDGTMNVSRGIRPDLDLGEDAVNDLDERFGDLPLLPQGTSEVTVGTGETGIKKPGEGTTETTVVAPPAKPVHRPLIDRPNVTRGIRPNLK